MPTILKSFNELSTSELYQILQLRCQVFILEQNCAYLDIDHLDLQADHLFYEEEGQVIAYCRLFKPGIVHQDAASIGRFLVREDRRKEGIGRDLIQKALDHLLNIENYPIVQISGQAYLKNFYQELGFEPTSDVYLEDDIPHLDFQIDHFTTSKES